MRSNLERIKAAVEIANNRRGYGMIAQCRVFMDGHIDVLIRRPFSNDKWRKGRVDGDRVRFAGTSCKVPSE